MKHTPRFISADPFIMRRITGPDTAAQAAAGEANRKHRFIHRNDARRAGLSWLEGFSLTTGFLSAYLTGVWLCTKYLLPHL